MKILKFKFLKDFARKHPDAADPLMRWAEFVEKTEWKSHAELKQEFPSADYVGNDRYQKGIEEGMSQRSLEIARKMLAKGMDEASSMDMTGLTAEDIKLMKAEM